MALTRNYQPSIYGKPSKKERIKKAKKAKDALKKIVAKDKIVQELLLEQAKKIHRATSKPTKYIAYKEGLKSSDFYRTKAWIELRYKVLVKYGRVCQCCGQIGGQIHVDHIKPRSKYPELELEINNLQVLCERCNIGKSNKDVTDWR